MLNDRSNRVVIRHGRASLPPERVKVPRRVLVRSERMLFGVQVRPAFSTTDTLPTSEQPPPDSDKQ